MVAKCTSRLQNATNLGGKAGETRESTYWRVRLPEPREPLLPEGRGRLGLLDLGLGLGRRSLPDSGPRREGRPEGRVRRDVVNVLADHDEHTNPNPVHRLGWVVEANYFAGSHCHCRYVS